MFKIKKKVQDQKTIPLHNNNFLPEVWSICGQLYHLWLNQAELGMQELGYSQEQQEVNKHVVGGDGEEPLYHC
jgi:hypothetical protein